MTARLSMTRTLPTIQRPGGSILARVVDALETARATARERAELRQRLRVDARLRRDIGLSRFELIRLSTDN